MIDEREIVRRAVEALDPPEPAFERLRHRRDRKRRNQRIAAGVVGIAVFVAAVWIVTTVGSLDRSETSVVPGGDVTGPAETGPTYNGATYSLGPVTNEDLAVGEAFMQAWVDGDGEAAAAMFAPEATFDGFQPAILPTRPRSAIPGIAPAPSLPPSRRRIRLRRSFRNTADAHKLPQASADDLPARARKPCAAFPSG